MPVSVGQWRVLQCGRIPIWKRNRPWLQRALMPRRHFCVNTADVDQWLVWGLTSSGQRRREADIIIRNRSVNAEWGQQRWRALTDTPPRKDVVTWTNAWSLWWTALTPTAQLRVILSRLVTSACWFSVVGLPALDWGRLLRMFVTFTGTRKRRPPERQWLRIGKQTSTPQLTETWP